MKFIVKTIDARTDEVRKYTIEGANALIPGADDFGPSRTVAGIRARERHAADNGEPYSPDFHKVLSIKEVQS